MKIQKLAMAMAKKTPSFRQDWTILNVPSIRGFFSDQENFADQGEKGRRPYEQIPYFGLRR